MDALGLVFPKSCLHCKKGDFYLCKSCVSKVSFTRAICPMCGKNSVDGVTHVSCQKPQGMDGLTSLWFYKGVVKKAILSLKYKFASDVSSEISSAFIQELKKADKPVPKDAVLVPIPLHKARYKWRGFNQVEEMGESIAKKIGWGCESDLLVRIKKRDPQIKVNNKEERLKNARGIFSLNVKHGLITKSHKPIVLFDDVWTTGATMREAAKVLKRNGAENVWGMTLAH